MPLYRRDASGEFVPLQETPFGDIEQVLEDWIEQNPHLLFDGEQLAVIARLPRTSYGKHADLLAIDQTGACVVIELKRGETPREVIAQAIEYAAWVDSLTLDDLNGLARAYAASCGNQVEGVGDL